MNGIDVVEEKLCYEKQMGEKTHRERKRKRKDASHWKTFIRAFVHSGSEIVDLWKNNDVFEWEQSEIADDKNETVNMRLNDESVFGVLCSSGVGRFWNCMHDVAGARVAAAVAKCLLPSMMNWFCFLFCLSKIQMLQYDGTTHDHCRNVNGSFNISLFGWTYANYNFKWISLCFA